MYSSWLYKNDDSCPGEENSERNKFGLNSLNEGLVITGHVYAVLQYGGKRKKSSKSTSLNGFFFHYLCIMSCLFHNTQTVVDMKKLLYVFSMRLGIVSYDTYPFKCRLFYANIGLYVYMCVFSCYMFVTVFSVLNVKWPMQRPLSI